MYQTGGLDLICILPEAGDYQQQIAAQKTPQELRYNGLFILAKL